MVSSISKLGSVESRYASDLIPWGMHLETCPSRKLMPAANTSAFEYLFNQYSTINYGRAPKFKTPNDLLQKYNFCLSATCHSITENPVKLKLNLSKNLFTCSWNLVDTMSLKHYSVHEIDRLKVNGLVKNNTFSLLHFRHCIRFFSFVLLSLSDTSVKENMAMLNHLTIKTRWKHSVTLFSITSNGNMLKGILQLPVHNVEFKSFYLWSYTTNKNFCYNKSYNLEKVTTNDQVDVFVSNMLLKSKSSMKCRYAKQKMLTHNKAMNTDMTGQLHWPFRIWWYLDTTIALEFHSSQNMMHQMFLGLNIRGEFCKSGLKLAMKILVAECKLQLACIILKVSCQHSSVCILHGFQARASVKLKSWDIHVESGKHDCYRFKDCMTSTNPILSCETSQLILVDINFPVKVLQYLMTEISQLIHSRNIHGIVFPHYCDPPSFPSLLIVMNTDKLSAIINGDTKRTVLLNAYHLFIKIFDCINLVFLPLPFDIFMYEISVQVHNRFVLNIKKCWSFPHYSDPPLHMKLLKNQSNILMFKTACDLKQLSVCLTTSQKLNWIHLHQEINIVKYNNLIKLKHCFLMPNSYHAVFNFTRCDDSIDIMICCRPSKSCKYANPEISIEQLLLIIILHGDGKLSLHLQLERCSKVQSNKIQPQHVPRNTLFKICDFFAATDQMLQYHCKVLCSRVQIKHCYHPPWYCSCIFIHMKLNNMTNKNSVSVKIYGFIWQQPTNGNDNHCFRHKTINKNLLIDKGKSVMVLQSNIRLDHKSFSITVDNVHLNTQLVISTRYTNTPAIGKLWSLRAASVMDNYKQHGTDCQLIFPHYNDPPSAEKRPCWSTITSKNIMLAFRWTENMYYKITFKSWNTEQKIHIANALNFPHYSDPPHHSSSWSLGTFHIMTTLNHCHVVSNFKVYTDHCEGTAYQSITNWKVLQTSLLRKMKLDHGRSNRDEHLTVTNASIHYFWCSIIWTLINQVCTGHQTLHNVSLLINFPHYCDPPIYLQNFCAHFFEYRYDYGLTANTNLQKFDGTYSTICKDGTARNENLNVIRYNFFRPLHDREENDTKLSSVELDCYVKKWNCIKNCTQILMLPNSIVDYLSSSMFGCNKFDSISEILKLSTSLSTEKQYYCGKDLLCNLTYPWKNKQWTSILNSFTTMAKTEFNIVARRINRNFITLCVENQITNHSNSDNITDTFSLLQSITTQQWQQEAWIWLVTKSVAQNVIDFLTGSYYVVIFGTILICLGISALQVFTARIQGKISFVKLSLMHRVFCTFRTL